MPYSFCEEVNTLVSETTRFPQIDFAPSGTLTHHAKKAGGFAA
jgi:hypothetical protein